MAILDVRHLKKIYTTRFGGNQVQALSNVNFSVEQGEYTAIMGESGSGKTTLLNILAALDRPTGGEVFLNGKDIGKILERELAAFRRGNLGFVFQEFNLLDNFSIRDNIFLPLVLAGKKYEEMERKLRGLAGRLGIQDILDKFPYEVSGGQKQRTAVARAVITGPKILLADEPTGALDSRATENLLELFDVLNDCGQTILMVTHSVKAASRAKRVLFIKDGEIFHQIYKGRDTSEALYQKISDTLTIAMYFIIHSLAENPSLDALMGSGTVRYTLRMASRVTALFAVIFLFYTNSFLMKQRKREFGLYNILGMEKRHLGRVIFCETVDVAFFGLLFGLLGGALLNKLMFLVLLRIFHNQVPIDFYFSPKVFMDACFLFLIIFLLIFLNSLRQIQFKSPMELLRESRAGEKEPKTRWVLAVFGVISLGSGYYLAVSITNPVAAVSLFFVAVFLVIIGTYCLFTAGSTAFLKLLRGRKRYYYKTNHFVSVSGMLYRMKQNAVGLANICILSTMVLVMVSSSLCLYAGGNEILERRYPRNLMISSYDYSEEMEEIIKEKTDACLTQNGISADEELCFRYLSFAALEKEDCFDTDSSGASVFAANDLRELYIVTLEDYEKLTGENAALLDGEIFISSSGKYKKDSLRIFDKEYKVKAVVDEFLKGTGAGNDVAKTYTLVVKDRQAMEELYALQTAAYGEYASSIRLLYGIDLKTDKEKQTAFYEKLFSEFTTPVSEGGAGLEVEIDCRAVQEEQDVKLFGGLFFIGIFLGFLFIMATILIIYYKQISEGFDDKERFAILQKVGMSGDEIKRSIHSQVLTVFFLPLIGAGIHMAFAFPFVTRVLFLFNMANVRLFALCTAGCFVVFAFCYLIIYHLTAKVYYKIVS